MAKFRMTDGCAAVSVDGKTISANKEGVFDLTAEQAAALAPHGPVPVVKEAKKAVEEEAPDLPDTPTTTGAGPAPAGKGKGK